MEQEGQFTDEDRSNLRQLIRDIARLADEDLSNSGAPAAMFGPWRIMFRQMLEAAIGYRMAHHELVDEASGDEVVHYFNLLRALEGETGRQSPVKLTGEIGDIYQAGMFSSDPDAMWNVPVKISELLAVALTAEFEAGAANRS